MDRICPITPEMLGLSWPHLIRRAILAGVIFLAACVLYSYAFHGKADVKFRELATEAITIGVLTLIERANAIVAVRVTATSIAETNLEGKVNGKIIRKEQVKRVKEVTRGRTGIEIIARRESLWQYHDRIFVPAALPEYEQIKMTVIGWQAESAHSEPSTPYSHSFD
jgi:hypothetical protein